MFTRLFVDKIVDNVIARPLVSERERQLLEGIFELRLREEDARAIRLAHQWPNIEEELPVAGSNAKQMARLSIQVAQVYKYGGPDVAYSR